MAYDGAKQPLEAGLFDPTLQTNQKKNPNRRRYRRYKSAPLADKVPQELCSESIFSQFSPSIKQVAIFLAIYIGVGTICFYLVRNQIKGKKTNGLIDSLYLSMETMTTVGYGDLVPHRSLSKLFSCIFSFSGMFLVGLILSKAAEYLVAKQELLLVNALHLHQKVGPTETLKEIEPKRVRFKCIIVAIVASGHMFVGTIFLSSIEEMDFLDALYCVCSTMTTLGYGDKSFQTPFGRFFAVFWILSSSTCLAHLYFYVTEYYVQGRQRSLVNWVLAWRMRSLDLEAADLDDDGFVGAAEFIIYKLKEKGKISEEDIELVREEMEELDVDQPRTLSASDIMLAQSNETGK